MSHQTYTFRCPVCAKRFRYESALEPACTGPSEMRDEHALTVMVLERVDTRNVDPVRAIARAAGPLIMAAR